jgi:hypothetical protein
METFFFVLALILIVSVAVVIERGNAAIRVQHKIIRAEIDRLTAEHSALSKQVASNIAEAERIKSERLYLVSQRSA